MRDREALKERLNELLMGYEADGTWVDGVVDFWSDDIDKDRLVDGVMSLFPEPEPCDAERKVQEVLTWCNDMILMADTNRENDIDIMRVHDLLRDLGD